MARNTFCLAGLKDFDLGKIDAAFRKELHAVVMDMVDRPDEKAARKVTLEIELIPQRAAGYCETAMMRVIVSIKIPSPSSRTYEVGVQKNGDLVVNDLSPDNINQATLDEIVPPLGVDLSRGGRRSTRSDHLFGLAKVFGKL